MYTYIHLHIHIFSLLKYFKNIFTWCILFDMAEVPVWCSSQIFFHLKITQTIMSHCISSYLLLKSYTGHWFLSPGDNWVVETSFKSCPPGLAASLAVPDVLQVVNKHYLLLVCDWTPLEWGSRILKIVWQF